MQKGARVLQYLLSTPNTYFFLYSSYGTFTMCQLYGKHFYKHYLIQPSQDPRK